MAPLQDITDLLRQRNQRNLTSIPNDQQELLKDSWAVDLKDTPHGLAHVPGHVLQTVKEAYMNRRAKDEKPPSKIDSPPASTTNDGEKNKKPPNSTPAGPSSTPSSPERSISWTPSPRQHQDVPIVESPVVRETPKARPIAPPPPPPPQLQAAPIFDSALSSGEEEELETELPQAQRDHLVPVNRAASRVASSAAHHKVASTATTNTPPCAQPDGAVIPNTLRKNGKPPSGSSNAVSRRPRLMKPFGLSDDVSPQAAKASTVSASLRLPTTKTFPETGSWNSTSSSSIIPATSRESQTRLTNGISPKSTAAPPENSAADAGEMMRANDQEKPYGHHGPIIDRQQVRRLFQAPTNGYTDPFTAFIATYPDYITVHAGNKQQFVSACFCLQVLQTQKALREYLYDDYIRAFASGYVAYAKHAQDAGQEILPAFEWFNCLDGPIIFNRMFVTKDNLDHILGLYPEDVERAREIIRNGNRKDKEPSPEPPARLSMGETSDSTHATDASREAEMRDRTLVVPKTRAPKTRPTEVRGPPTKQPLQRLPSPELGSEPITYPPPPESSVPPPELSVPPPPESSVPDPTPPRKAPRPSQYLQRPASSSRSESKRPPPPESSVPDPTPIRKAPRSSQYFERLVSTSRSESKRKRSAEEQVRLREHFRKRRATGPGSFVNSRAGS